ncbi:hypothetical protein LXL04_027317 [Taraxacum kok-saghyz]
MFECNWSGWLWTRMGLWWKISIPRRCSLVDMMKWVEDLKMDKKAKTVMKVSMCTMLKRIWTDRNDIIFKRRFGCKLAKMIYNEHGISKSSCSKESFMVPLRGASTTESTEVQNPEGIHNKGIGKKTK